MFETLLDDCICMKCIIVGHLYTIGVCWERSTVVRECGRLISHLGGGLFPPPLFGPIFPSLGGGNKPIKHCKPGRNLTPPGIRSTPLDYSALIGRRLQND